MKEMTIKQKMEIVAKLNGIPPDWARTLKKYREAHNN